ncbi:MAG: GAF domain-containing protein [Pseudonocardia sp.]
MPAADPRHQARRLAAAREAALGGHAEEGPRPLVSESWRRSLAARVDPERGEAPLVFDRSDVHRIRDAHPLAPVLPLLRDTLVSIADEAMHMMIVTDADGHILWREGRSDVLRRGERVGLVEGAGWSETAAGTNAMGTALAADRPVRIHSAEHLVRSYHEWTCAAAPIHDPDSGEMIGVVDVTGPLRTFHPTTLALVVAAARLAEGHLATRQAQCDERLLRRNLPHLLALRGEPGALLTANGRVLAAQPEGWLPDRVELPDGGDRVLLGSREAHLEPLADGWLLRTRPDRAGTPAPVLELAFLGGGRPSARLDGRPVRLTHRHVEMVALLALRPDGRTGDELATDLYGEDAKLVTVRAEMHRLRVSLGMRVVRAQPYRLQARIVADFLGVRAALAEGRVRDAARAYRGQLLPRSDAPAIREEREQLHLALRRAVLDGRDVEAAWLLHRVDGDDLELAEQLLGLIGRADPRRPEVAARVARSR